jgi:hypothetical protein
MATSVSEQTKTDALKIAKGIQKPGQNKEQTKLISQGIEKGIAQYKQLQKAKSRESDKQRKQALKAKEKTNAELSAGTIEETEEEEGSRFLTYLPWGLLILSWAGFVAFQTLNFA